MATVTARSRCYLSAAMTAVPHIPDSGLAKELGATLDALAAEHRLTYLKLGTEAEALSFEEVALLGRIRDDFCDAHPMMVGKIGGPDARNDLFQLDRIGVDGYVAPMVESPYGLRIFLDAVAMQVKRADPLLGINIETGLAVEQLPGILQVEGVTTLGFINVGRSDLSSSVGLAVNAPEVTEMTCRVIAAAQARGISGHVGGQVTGRTLVPIIERVQPDGFHTRFLAFDMKPGDPIDERARRALECEIVLLRLLAAAGDDERRAIHESRIEVTRGRLG
jgi:hypothetical protein